MRFLPLFLMALILGSCARDPLSERVEKLEERVGEVEGEQEEERTSLMERLDQVAVTADNADEVDEIRAKLAQTDISPAEFERLRDRVLELERRIGGWSEVVNGMQRSVYAVIHAVFVSEDDIIFTFVGTGFATTSGNYSYQRAYHRCACPAGRSIPGFQQEIRYRPGSRMAGRAEFDILSRAQVELFLHRPVQHPPAMESRRSQLARCGNAACSRRVHFPADSPGHNPGSLAAEGRCPRGDTGVSR